MCAVVPWKPLSTPSLSMQNQLQTLICLERYYVHVHLMHPTITIWSNESQFPQYVALFFLVRMYKFLQVSPHHALLPCASVHIPKMFSRATKDDQPS